MAILRDLALGNVHAAHDLQAGNDGALQLGRHGQNAAEQAVDTHTHHHLALLRLEMDIARALGKGALDEGVDKADGRRALAAVAVLHELCWHDIRPGGACLALHLFNDAGGALAAVEAADGLLGRAVRGDHRNHALARGGLDLLLRDEVQRIAHREVEGVAHQLHRHHAVFLRQRARHIFRQLHRNGYRREIDELHTELYFQRLDELLLGDDAALHQHVAQTLLTFLLQFQRPLKLLVRDHARGQQQVAQPHICHRDSPQDQ